MTCDKRTIVARVHEQTGLDRRELELALDAIISTVKKAVKKGERVEIRGFGSFTTRECKAKWSGLKNMPIPACTKVIFKASRRYFKYV